MGPIYCPQKPVSNYRYTLHNIPEERRSQSNCVLIKISLTLLSIVKDVFEPKAFIQTRVGIVV